MITQENIPRVTPAARNCSRFQAFMQSRVSLQPPVPCEYQAGDVVTVTNGYGIEIPGVRIIGFVKEIDPEWRPDSYIFLDWDCYWFAESPENIKAAL